MDNNQKTDIFYQHSLEITFIKGCEAIFFVFAVADMIGILRKNALLAQFCLTITTKNSNLKTYPQAINIALRKTWMIVLKNFNEKNLNNIRNFICFLGRRPINMLFSICLLLMSIIPNNWNRKHLLTSCFDNLINVLYFIPKKKYEKIHSTAFVISRKLKTSWQEVCYKSKKDDQMLKMVIGEVYPF